MLLLVVLPLGNHLFTNLALLLAFLNGLLSLRAKDWKASLSKPMVWSSMLFYLLYALSLLWTDNLGSGGRQLETKLSFLLAPFIISASASYLDGRMRKPLLNAFLLGLTAACLWALGNASWLAIQEGALFYDPGDGLGKRYFFTYTHLARFVMHPGYFSTYIGFGIFACIYLINRSKAKFGYYGLLIFFFLMMVLLQGRINLLAMILVLGAGALIWAIKQRAYIWLLLPLIPVLLLLGIIWFGSPVLKKRFVQLPNFEYDISGSEFNSATYRLAEWKCAGDVISENPVLGVGIGDKEEALLESYRQNKFWVGLEKRFNAHNQYVETSLAIGLIGLFSLVFMLWTFGKTYYKSHDYLSLACLVFFALSMLTESMLERAWAVLLFCIFFPLFALLKKSGEA
jgi:O-antigen ligase